MKERGFMRSKKSFALRYGSVVPTENGETLDLSHRGLCFRCNSMPPSREIVVRMDTGDKVVDLIVRQKWIQELANARYNRYKIGVELVQAPKNYHRMVQKLVYH
ncbi:MAG: hypothetical protein DRJ14_01165 [Acidobacteria bacterium]|nr:MAG: hypothetical protein DRJ14_01165 [Acidobacteriota bacterium]